MIEQLRRLFSTATLREGVSYQSLEKVFTYLLNREIVFKGKVDLTQADVRGLSSGSSSWDDIKDKPASFPPSSHTHPEKQDTLVSGVNIKTVNTQSLLGSGDITISGGVTSVNAQTGVVVLDADDISDSSTTNKFVTASDLTNLGNLSGVNSGDQDLSGYAEIVNLGATAFSNDYDDLDNKPTLFSLPSLSSGSVLFSNGTTIDQDNSNFFWNNTTKRLGLGLSNPTKRLDIWGTTSDDILQTNIGINFTQVSAPPNTYTCTAISGSGLEIGTYYYRIVYYTSIGETGQPSFKSVTTTSGNQQVQITNIPISSDLSVIGRKIYRSKVAWSSSYGSLVATISDNVSTSYIDNFPEASQPTVASTVAIWSKPNTTNKFLTVGDQLSMFIDEFRTTFGYRAGVNLTYSGHSNTLIGSNAGRNITSGFANTIIGDQCGYSLTTGNQNYIIGQNALKNGTAASYNIAIGPNALYATNGNGNTALGYYTGNSLTGSYNTLLGGWNALSQNLGNYNIGIGTFINFPNATGSNQLNIGNTIYGTVGTTTPYAAGVIGITTTTPRRKLDVLDASNPQLRLTHTDGSIFTDFQTDSSGYALIDPTGARLRVDGALLSLVLVEANTAGVGSPNAITAAESNTVFTNEGASALNYHTLPTAVAGLVYTFYVQDTDGIRVVANTGDTIRINTSVSASAGYAESTTVGSSVTLTAINATEWVATSVIGTWTLT